jgi:3-deoxy-manno-octulosonate cytidylyltransferase (CMP-KDO synthetase)
MRIIGIIPARYASSRFPGKPLVDIDGKTMIQRVYEQAKKALALSDVVVATDDQRIVDNVLSFSGKVVLTSDKHNTGTERCNEVILNFEKHNLLFDVAINIQGDEPFIDPRQVDKLALCFADEKVQIATLIKKLESAEELFSPNIIKVVVDKAKKAMYFSRSPIPFLRGKEKEDWIKNSEYFKHIGIYAYRTNILKDISFLKPTPCEISESLEQLRWLENGYYIHTEITEFESHSIDVPEDLLKVKKL